MRFLVDAITRAAGVDSPAGLGLRRMFATVLRHRGDADVELELAAGSPRTTPGILEVSTGLPQPWLFFRIGVLALATYAALVLAWEQTGNRNLVPALILTGSAAMPVTTLTLFFECNVRRNVSLYQVTRLALLGGVLAMLAALFLYRVSDLLRLQWLGSPLSALVEEPAKLLALGLVIGSPRWRGPLNGLLFGAAVGAGFAAFESAGFAFRAGLLAGAPAMREVILLRGLLAPFSHVVWTALAGAALWRARGDGPFTLRTLADRRFLQVFALVLLLHMAWDSGRFLPWHGLYLLTGLVGWVVAAGFLGEGLEQLRREQSAARGA